MIFKENKKSTVFGRRGFTLIEIIMGMAIVTFLSATMFRVIKVSDTQQGLIMNAEKVKASLRLAQANSLSIPQESGLSHVCGYGLKGAKDSGDLEIYYKYIEGGDLSNLGLCDGGTDDVKETITDNIKLDEKYQIKADVDVFFKSPYGEVRGSSGPLGADDKIEILVENNESNKTKTITINSAGKIVF
jgi:prepilin-type N-terminal cleavage/methylation domain-containing protein